MTKKPKFEDHFESSPDPQNNPDEKSFVVRLWDGMDGCWTDVSDSVTEQEATRIWNEKTENGTKKISYNEIDYYRIFPANTEMKWSGGAGKEMFR